MHYLGDRATYQRENIGPVFNHLANQVYDTVEHAWRFDETRQLVQPNTYHQLGVFVDSVEGVLDCALDTFFVDTPKVERVVSTMLSQVVEDTLPTFWTAPRAVLREGVKSGIAMPLHIYWRAQEEAGHTSVLLEEGLDTNDLITQMRDIHFQAATLALAHIRNGVYKDDASLLFADMFRHTSPLVALGVERLFSQSTAHTALTPEVKATLADRLNQQVVGHTDGCPVRRSVYPVLGGHALAYAEAVGIDPDELRNPRCSAIVRGCHLIADLLESLPAAA